jgi:hypothetical protein
VSERLVATLVVDAVALTVETVVPVTVLDARLPSEAVKTPLLVVTVETATGTEVATVATGAKVNRPILAPVPSAK